jgi:N6-adenosine-specific RNA methylase IME4
MTETAALPPGPFQLILADPPWAFRTHTSEGRTPTQKKFQEAEDHYPTMQQAEMAALPIGDVAGKDALLAMWIVGSHCDAALDLGRAWGFEFCTDLFYWLKQKRIRPDQMDLFTGDIAPLPMSMGYYSRKQIEPCWLFKRGKGLPVLDHGVRQLIVAPKRSHSRKPAEQYDRLDALFGTDCTRLELFSRTPRAGWTAWGNEVGKFEEEPA